MRQSKISSVATRFTAAAIEGARCIAEKYIILCVLSVSLSFFSTIIRKTFLCACLVTGARSRTGQMHSIYRRRMFDWSKGTFERFTAFSFPLYFYLARGAKRYTTECDIVDSRQSLLVVRNCVISHSLPFAGREMCESSHTRFFLPPT